MTLLTAAQDAMTLCGLSSPATVIGNTDASVAKFLAFAQMEADQTGSDFNWRSMYGQLVCTGDGATATFTLPANYERIAQGWSVYSSKYPTTPLRGPVSTQELLGMKSFPVYATPSVWRLTGNKIEFFPVLASGETATVDYRTFYPIVAADLVTAKPRWTVDTDLALFPEIIIRTGMIWRWKQSKGLDYAEDYRTYSIERDKKAAHEVGAGVVSMTGPKPLRDDQWYGKIGL